MHLDLLFKFVNFLRILEEKMNNPTCFLNWGANNKSEIKNVTEAEWTCRKIIDSDEV